MKYASCILPLVSILASAVIADQLDIGGVKYNGSFDHYEGQFHFTTGSGKERAEKPSRVKALMLEEPVLVTFSVRSDRKEYKGLLKGYEYSHFLLEVDGKEASVHDSVIVALRPHKKSTPPPPPPPIKPERVQEPAKPEPPPRPASPREVEIPREARDSQRYPVPNIDTDALARRDLSKEQRKALSSFVEAKAAYDRFMNSSSSAVARLDKATGREREALLSELRMRKNKEQPLKDALLKAHRTLEDAL